MATIDGYATEEGTARYRGRVGLRPAAWRRLEGLWISSVGLGTYLGDPDDLTDQLYAGAIGQALALGLNLIDTAINYRCQRSERAIGAALGELIDAGRIRRDEVVICTKGGYLPYNADFPADPSRYLVETFLTPGVLQPEELVGGCHAISPTYLAHQLAWSLRNLRVACVDVYYLHNPEQQLEAVSPEEFWTRIERAIGFLEDQARRGVIRRYGVATWQGLRAQPGSDAYLSLEALVEVAKRVGGPGHRFRVVQAPLNLAMPELYGFKNQQVGGTWMSLLKAAERLGVSVITSASLLQRQLAALPDGIRRLIPGPSTDAQRAIQFARSVPGVAACLVGMKQLAHVNENLGVMAGDPLTSDELGRLFGRPANRREHDPAVRASHRDSPER
ncbi:MAG: aldo/keto reductase [Candidatus Omnitrophica bacterium]|nr:aldo/keto reductase [Candidatus Omnitrophota bacterium]